MTEPSTKPPDREEALLGDLVEEFTGRRRAGDRPDIEDYASRHPEHAASIREILGTIVALDEHDPASPTEALGGIPISRVGDYRIERELGRGGMGVVFLALDERLGRRVALKFLPVQATIDPRFLERFRREARAAAGLQHPHIVPVYGVGSHEGLHYYAMQYVDGHSLDEVTRVLRDPEAHRAKSDGDSSSVGDLARGLLKRELSDDSDSDAVGPVAIERTESLAVARPPESRAIYRRNVARLGLHVARALAYAHARGILHRDVKPGNLLLDARGHVWITDFGLCATSEESGGTKSSDLVGTLRYMAPEQVEGRADVRSDVYGLGITLYELLTFRAAFEGSHRAALMKQIAERDPIRPRRIDAGIPSDFEAIVRKATAKLPEERYGTAQALADDLRAFLDGRPILARPPGALHLLNLAIRRNQVLAATIAGAALVLMVATVLYLLGVQEARAKQARQLYLANVAAAAASIESDPVTARRSLEDAPVAHRNWEWEHLRAQVDQSVARVAELGGRIRDIAATPDGSRLVTTAGNRLVVIDLDAHTPPRFSEPLPSPILALSVHPDGTRVALVDETTAMVMELTEVPRLVAQRSMGSPPIAVRFDSSGARLYVASITGLIRQFDAALENEGGERRGHRGPVEDLVSAPDGRLISAGADRTVRVWDPESGRARILQGHETGIHSLDLSSDGKLLSSLDAGGVLRIWDLDTGEPLASLRGPLGGTVVRFSPDGRLLVSASGDRTLRVWDVADALPVPIDDPAALVPALERASDPSWHRELRALVGHGTPAGGLAFLPDGRLFSASDEGIVLEWNVECGGGSLVLAGHVSDTWGLAFDSTGTRLVSTSRDSTVRIWNAETGRLLKLLYSGSVPYGVSFSPDGREVAVVCRDGALRIWDVESGEKSAELVCPEREVNEQIQGRVGYDRSGDRLFVVEHLLGFDVWERTRAGWNLARHEPVPGAFSLEVSPDGNRVAIGTVGGTLRVVDTRTYRACFEVEAHAGRIRSLGFRSDGQALATAGPDGLAKVWSIPEGERLVTLPIRVASVHEGDIEGIAFSPDGSRLACVLFGTGVGLWDPESGAHVTTLQGPGHGYNQVVFDPSGRRIASGSWGGTVRIWDTVSAVERGKRLRADFGGRNDSPGRDRAAFASFLDLLDRARRLLRSGELDAAKIHEARWIGRGLLQEHSADPRATVVYGEALYREGALAESLPRFEAAVVASEDLGRPQFDAYVFLAMAKARSGLLEEAEVALARARSLVSAAQSFGRVGPRDLLSEAERTLREAGERSGR